MASSKEQKDWDSFILGLGAPWAGYAVGVVIGALVGIILLFGALGFIIAIIITYAQKRDDIAEWLCLLTKGIPYAIGFLLSILIMWKAGLLR